MARRDASTIESLRSAACYLAAVSSAGRAHACPARQERSDDRRRGARRPARGDVARIDWVRDGQAALDATSCQQYDLVVLDLGLPKVGGLEVLDALRRKGHQVPLVILTARDATDDRVRGLDGGADDYVAKPFEMAELLARLRAVLRRRGGTASPILGNDLVTLDPATREASRPAGEPVRLSAKEFALLRALLVRPGRSSPARSSRSESTAGARK